jgi:hypothetical protein
LPLGPELLIFKSMMREEWRLHKSFQGAIGSHVFPAVIFAFSAFLSLSAPLILGNIEASRILLLIHLGALGYGLFVGAMGYIGEQVMTRRLGQVNMVLGIPRLLPVSFRRVMAVFYVKDAVYYVLYSIIPLVLGAAVGAPLAGVSLLTVGRLGLTAFLAFMTGMGASFLLSAAHIRSRVLLGSLMLLLGCSVASVWPLGALRAGDLLLPLGYWYGRESLYLLSSVVVALLLSAAAILLMRERFEAPQRASVEMFSPVLGKLSSLGDLGGLLAKEWVELRRGGALGPVVAGYIAPLVVIYAMVWLLGEGLGVPIYFNVVFYGGFVGFLGVTVYSWINNLECNEFLNVQPVGVDDVVRAKLVLYFALTFSVSTCYVLAIGFLNGELGLLGLALLASLSNTVYVGAVTSRLTGLWTNTMLFDAKVLSKFAACVVPPLVAVLVASFMIGSAPSAAAALLIGVSAAILIASLPILRSLKGKWSGHRFSFANNS